jgi:hypothetical protein
MLHTKSSKFLIPCLQVLFMDNIELRFLSKNHNDLPRIKVFDQGYLKRMTEACAS